MKITDVTLKKLQAIGPYMIAAGLDKKPFTMILVQIHSDEGITGNFISTLTEFDSLKAELPVWKRVLKGRDPHYVEQICQQVTAGMVRVTHLSSYIDFCLWDLLGKYHKVPVYHLLGAQKNKMPCYTSTLCYETIDEYVEEARRVEAMGIRGFKLHGAGGPDKDIEACTAVRAACPNMHLMLDAVNAYDREGALRVGRVLEKLNFEWYESPIKDDDWEGYRHLRGKLDVPIAAGEMLTSNIRGLKDYLNQSPVDIFRTIGDFCGGISVMRRMAAICDAYEVRFHPHSYGSTLGQAAHFNVMLANKNSKWLELPLPLGDWARYMKDTVEIDENGNAIAPSKSGLGYEVDLEAIEAGTVETA